MERRDFYKNQRVVQSEMDAAFSDAEQADWNQRVDDALFGVISGLVPSLGSAPNVVVTKGIAYDQLGRRIRAFSDGASSKTQSYATATDGTPTSVTGGNERWISIYANFGRLALDPRTDGDGNTVYFDQPENLHDGTVGVNPPAVAGLGGAGVDKFLIVAGASAGTGTAVKPALLTTAILLCDIKRTPSDASNVLDTTRRQLLNVADTAAPGTGLAVLMSALSTWLGGRTFPAQATLNAALSKILTDLAATAASDDGAERIGAEGHGFVSSGSVRSQLNALIDEAVHLSGSNHFTGAGNTQTLDGHLSVGGNAAVTGNETVGGTLGVTGVTTLGTRERVTPTQTVPAIDTPTVAEDTRQLLLESNFTRTARNDSKLRIYLNNKKLASFHPTRSLLITFNVAWNGSQWLADGADVFSTNDIVYAIEIGGSRGIAEAAQHVFLPSIILYRLETGNSNPAPIAFNDADWTGASCNVLDIGRVFSTLGSGVTNFLDDNQSGLQRGVNYLNPVNGEFRIGASGADNQLGQRIHFGVKDVAAAGGEVHGGVVSFPNSYTATPSHATVNTIGGNVNLGAITLTVQDHRYATWQATSVAAGAIQTIANVDVSL